MRHPISNLGHTPGGYYEDGGIVTFSATYGRLRLRSVITILVAVWVLVGVAGCCSVRSEPSESGPAHAVFTSLGGEFAVNADHAAADCAMSPVCPHAFAMAVPPLSVTALVALGTAVAVTTIVGSVAHGAVPAKGPPGGVFVALTGQDVLTRFCLARR